MPIDEKAMGQWKRAGYAYAHYRAYIATKTPRASLTFADFVFVANFKGGSATVAEPLSSFGHKAAFYAAALENFYKDPGSSQPLGRVSAADYPRLRNLMVEFASLPERDESHISGFGPSFASTLLHFHFPELVPILDKRALNGCGVPGIRVDSQNNVTNLLSLFPALIDQFRTQLTASPHLSLRQLDEQAFIQKLNRPPFRQKRPV